MNTTTLPAWARTDLARLPVLSIRQPWAWMIVRPDLTDPTARALAQRVNHTMKDVENRAWSPHNPGRKFRGRFLIHAGKGCTRNEYLDACAYAQERGVTVPPLDQLDRGGIVGMATAVDFVDAHLSPWFMGPSAIVLMDVQPLPFLPCAGQLGFFRLPTFDSLPV